MTAKPLPGKDSLPAGKPDNANPENMGGPAMSAALPSASNAALGGLDYPHAAYDTTGDRDKNGEPAHLSSQAADPGTFDKEGRSETKRLSDKR